MRWATGYTCNGSNFRSFWQQLATDFRTERRALLIAGRGFDPRTIEVPRALEASAMPVVACHLIRLSDKHDRLDPGRSEAAASNEQALRELFSEAEFEIRDVPRRDDEGRLIGGPKVRAAFSDLDWLSGFTDVIVDITALPTSIAFPLLGQLLNGYDQLAESHPESAPYNLHCVVCENPEVDELILHEGGDAADYIDIFRGKSGRTSETEPITIWAPVLGENQYEFLRKIYETLSPQETKPILPFPSKDPRRGDDLISEYHTLLFDTWQIDPRGLIYASERDPFDVYHQLSRLAHDYTESLAPLGPVHTVVSVHTSKLLSLGVLLAAYEHQLGVIHVEPTDYALNTEGIAAHSSEIFEVWLAGEAYVANV